MAGRRDGQHEIRLLQTANGQPGPILTGHTDAITGLRFSRDGNVLYSGSLDLTVRQWDLLSGKGIARLDTPAAVQAIELVDTSLPTEQQPAPPQLLVTGHADSQLRVWNPISATSLLSPLSFVEKTAVSLDGRLLAVSDATGLIRILSLVEGPQLGREMASWRIERGVTALAFVPARPAGQPPTDEPLTDQLLVTGATDGTIRIWSPFSRSLLHEWRGDPWLLLLSPWMQWARGWPAGRRTERSRSGHYAPSWSHLRRTR